MNNCKRQLVCGHYCKKKCREPCGDCREMVIKDISECKHAIRIKCSEEPTRKLCNQKCPLTIPCGHACENKCKEPCTARCKVLVDHTHATACGHSFKIECNVRSDATIQSNSFKLLKFCTSPCGATLSCGHTCSGTCGECAQGRIHKTCSEKCGAVLLCGHPCTVSCREACQLCERNCSYRCRHRACKKKCGEPCTRCREKCTRKCRHAACEALCGDKCTVAPCNQPCEEKLACGHACVGFCGDPCPVLCKICNNKELTEILFGDEDEEDARFVMLDECRHVLESNGMETWLRGEETEQRGIAPKCCPKCKTLLTSTQRYSDYIKDALRNISKLKVKFFGTLSENHQKQQDLIKKLNSVKRQGGLAGVIVKPALEKLEKTLNPKYGGIAHSLAVLTTFTSKLKIIEHIVTAYNQQKLLTSDETDEYARFLLKALMQNETRITGQEILNFQREVSRFYCQCQLMYLAKTDGILLGLTLFVETKEILFLPATFTNAWEETVASNIKELSSKINIPLSKAEFEEVVSAMKMESGHWFECPNEHIYAIGECGGAMQEGVCVECKEPIGGTHHALLTGNRHSSRPDGSRFAAYSEQANNLFNYQEFMDFH